MFMVVGVEVCEQVKRGDVTPLQIIDKKNQRIMLVGQATKEPAENIKKAIFRFNRRQRVDLRLRTDQHLQFRKDIGDHHAVGADCLGDFTFP